MRNWLAQYGEIEAIKDLASVLNELSQEWEPSNTSIGSACSDAASLMSEAAFRLETAENHLK